MNYEQEYKKAFEAAKGLHDAGNALTKKQMEIVFPKLAESEDERIRKEIIHYILYKADGVSEEQEHSWIAYLEKQKEQKKSLSERFRPDFPSVADFIERVDELEKNNAMKEQKPAEWSEEDERIRKAILGFLNPDKGGTKYSSNAELVEWSDWLKSLRPVSKESLQTHWKPSEEQMKALQNAIALTACDKELVRLYNQLKKL